MKKRVSFVVASGLGLVLLTGVGQSTFAMANAAPLKSSVVASAATPVANLNISAQARVSSMLVRASSPASYYAYGTLSQCFRSERARVRDGKYFRDARNDCGRATVKFVNLETGSSTKVYGFAKGQSKRISIPLSGTKRAHYALLVTVADGPTLSGGVWTPRYGSWYWPTTSSPYFTACSLNPLSVPAVYNGLSSTMSGSWRLKSYTHGYVKPGGNACVKWSQPRHTLRKVKVTWNSGKKSWTDGKEVVARY